MPAKKSSSSAGSPAGAGKPLTIPYSPPAGAVRQATGQVFPSTPRGWFNAVAGVAIGVAAATVLIGLMPADEKWAGAMVSGIMGIGLGVTAPVASIPGDIGWGMLGPAAFYLYLNLTGQICSPTTASPVVMKEAAADNFVPLPSTPDEPVWTNPWDELGYTG